MSADRESTSLDWPPDDPAALAGFPQQTLETDRTLFRVVRTGQGSWWFGCSLAGRFDLPAPEGTCYLAADELSALLELLGPDLERGAVSVQFLEQRRLRSLRVPSALALADLTARRAAGFGVTSEIGSMVPYDRPQAWAARLRQAGVGGLVYWLRHDPSRVEGFALFGPRGERKGWKRGREHAISSELIDRLREECGIEVLEIPRANQLRLL